MAKTKKAEKKELMDAVETFEKATVVAEETPVVQETPDPAAQAQLTVTDIKDLLVVIDAASKRGAFHAAEMESVGKLYNRVKGFVDAVEPKAETQAGDTPAAE